MNTYPLRWSLLLLACVLSSACQDRRGPVKPTVAPPSVVLSVAS